MKVERVARVAALADFMGDPDEQEAARGRRAAKAVVQELATGANNRPDIPAAESLKHRYPKELSVPEEAAESYRPVHKIA